MFTLHVINIPIFLVILYYSLLTIVQFENCLMCESVFIFKYEHLTFMLCKFKDVPNEIPANG